MISDPYINMAIGVLSGSVGWFVKRLVRNYDSLVKRINDLEGIVETLSAQRSSATKLAPNARSRVRMDD